MHVETRFNSNRTGLPGGRRWINRPLNRFVHERELLSEIVDAAW